MSDIIYDTSILCKYGCGNPGKFPLKGFYNKNQYCCSDSHNKCPANKLKNKNSQPIYDELRKQEFLDNVQQGIINALGENYNSITGQLAKQSRITNNPNTYIDMVSKMEKTCLEKFGVKNASQNDQIKNKKSITCLEKFGTTNYFKSNSFKEHRLEKQQTLIQDRFHELISRAEYLTFDNSMPDRINYNKLVRKITTLSKRILKLSYDTSQFHLDHKFSILSGYLNKIPPEIIGHFVNLEIISKEINLSKRERCSISLEYLLSRIEESKLKLYDWQTLISTVGKLSRTRQYLAEADLLDQLL